MDRGASRSALAGVTRLDLGSSAPVEPLGVTRLYIELLRRLPTDQEQREGLSAERPDLFLRLLDSGVFQQREAFVEAAYLGVLGRDADYNGWNFSANYLEDGQLTQEMVVKNLLASDERKLALKRPPPDGADPLVRSSDAAEVLRTLASAQFRDAWQHRIFVESLYKTLLRREADAPGMSACLEALRSGITRRELASNKLKSREYNMVMGGR
jgi:hypothetical protein